MAIENPRRMGKLNGKMILTGEFSIATSDSRGDILGILAGLANDCKCIIICIIHILVSISIYIYISMM
jgi:hypothetical protein